MTAGGQLVCLVCFTSCQVNHTSSGLTLVSSLRQRRAAAGLSQTELAARVGVSRQALSAIEAGRQIPSTALALHLARALRCVVDDLFRLAGGPVVEAVLAGPVRGGGRRVVLGRVDGELVAHPLGDDSRAADGLVLGDPLPGEAGAVELVGDPAAVEANVLVAGCAPLLGVLAARLGRSHANLRATWIPANSAEALELLARGLVHVAGVHLGDASHDPNAHREAARRALPGQRASLINLARWRQGLVVAPGNPLAIALGTELRRPTLRHVSRERGAGAQRVFARVLAEAGVDAATLAGPVARDHAELARLIRWGVGDVGVAIEAAALAEGLDFIPLSDERFDLVVAASRLDTPAVARLLALLDRPVFRAEAAGLRGYDLSLAGEVSTVAPARARA